MHCDRCMRGMVTEHDHAVQVQGRDLRIKVLEVALKQCVGVLAGETMTKQHLVTALQNGRLALNVAGSQR